MVAGPKTNAAFLHALITHPTFADAKMDTGFIGRELERLAPAGVDARAIAFGVARLLAGGATIAAALSLECAGRIPDRRATPPGCHGAGQRRADEGRGHVGANAGSKMRGKAAR